MIVVQPNNPTGSCLTGAKRMRSNLLCAERQVALIADEVFSDFDGPPRATSPLLLGRRNALTFGLNGISKLAGFPR